jgi:hypothetical protein
MPCEALVDLAGSAGRRRFIHGRDPDGQH